MASVMGVEVIGEVLFRQIGCASSGFEVAKEATKGKSSLHGSPTDCCGWAGKFLLMGELRNKILTLRDILDLPPCNESVSIYQLLVATVEDLHKLYPKHVSFSASTFLPSQEDHASLYQGLYLLEEALKCVRDSWFETGKGDDIIVINKIKDEKEVASSDTSLEQLCERVLSWLENMNGLARYMLDVIEEEHQKNGSTQQGSTFGDFLSDSFLDNKSYCDSPHTPTSVLPETTQCSLSLGYNFICSPPMLLPLRLQAVGKLKPIDVKRLYFHVPPFFQEQPCLLQDETRKEMDDSETRRNQEASYIQVEMGDSEITTTRRESSSSDGNERQKEPKFDHEEGDANKIVGDKGETQKNPSVVPTPPTLASPKGGSAPPPPPPLLGVTKALRPKRSNTKLKRSTQMGSLYRLLKGKLEGSRVDVKSSHGRKNHAEGGASTDKRKGMADALAEMTKRSGYFRQIEDDVQKHATTIMEMKSAINSFQTKDMPQLLRFHSTVDLHLEDLIDETQVLSRFDGFPEKKLDTIRMAATLYSRLNSIATNLESWKIIASPLSRQLDKVECYFDKIKVEVDTIERNKETEARLFESHNIIFDYNVLVRIKELMVDVSSNCIEMGLQESKVSKEVADKESRVMAKNRLKTCLQMLWRTFQLAFRAYTFAGGQDDRAEKLASELAKEIETYP